MILEWNLNMQPNGMGWISTCDQFAIRECIYLNGQAKEFWCYYRPEPSHKFMHIPGRPQPSFEAAKALCQVRAENAPQAPKSASPKTT